MEKEEKKDDFNISTEEMAKVGVQFGHQTFRIHPKIEPYLAGARNNIHIIDLEKTAEKLKEALRFIQEMTSQGKILLLIGTKIQIKDLVESVARECDLPFVSERWLGGTFTNFEVMKKRVEYFKDLEKKKREGGLEKYTKKERAKIDQELKKLETKFGGIKNLEKITDAIFVIDMKKDELAVKEARQKGVTVIGIAHTNVDPNLADYPIPANDDARSSVQYILNKVKEVILSSKPKKEAEKETEKEEEKK
jgi:small subunit ribosomal protein S2